MSKKFKKYPWLYLVICDHCPVSCYTVAWRALALIICLRKEGIDPQKIKVIRYRLSSSTEVMTEREDVTQSFLTSSEKY